MLIGYARVSKSDGSQALNLQKDALLHAGIEENNIYCDYASGKLDDRPNLQACLKALRKGEDTLVVWKLDRLGRNLKHLIEIIHDLQNREILFKVLTGHGANIDTSTANGRLIFSIFAALAEYERELISERTKAGLVAARSRGRKGGRKHKMTPTKVFLAQGALEKPDTKISELCKELGITRQTLYRYLSPTGQFREDARKLIKKRKIIKMSSELLTSTSDSH